MWIPVVIAHYAGWESFEWVPLEVIGYLLIWTILKPVGVFTWFYGKFFSLFALFSIKLYDKRNNVTTFSVRKFKIY